MRESTGTAERLLFILFLVAALGLTGGRVIPAYAQSPPACPTLVPSNTTLKSDCVGTIVVATSGVTLNLGGHTVDCEFAFPEGIVITDQSDVRVTNGTITNCAFGILVTRGVNHIFDTNLNLVVVAYGIALEDAHSSHLRSLTISQAACVGVLLGGSSNNRLDSLVITTRSRCPLGFENFGIAVVPSSLSAATDNVITSSSVAGFSNGIFVFASDANTIQSSTINNNAWGILLNESNSNTIQSNTATNQLVDGIAIYMGAANIITANTADMNLNGIHVLAGSTDNTITSNVALNNGGSDLEDDNPNCDNNTWSHNRFNTANQPCIH